MKDVETFRKTEETLYDMIIHYIRHEQDLQPEKKIRVFFDEFPLEHGDVDFDNLSKPSKLSEFLKTLTESPRIQICLALGTKPLARVINYETNIYEALMTHIREHTANRV